MAAGVEGIPIPNGFTSWNDVPDRMLPATRVDSGKRSERTAATFVKGPLAIGWLAAIAASGHNKAVWVVLAFKSQIDRRREVWVTPPPSILSDFGVNRVNLSRAIGALERSGLLEVQRRPGRPPLVRLLTWGETNHG
jgi:hypothetical protein